MSKTAPRRIWIDAERTYSATSFSAGIEYIRADLHEAEVAILKASNARLVEALEKIMARDSNIDATPRGSRQIMMGNIALIARAALQENDHE